MAVIARCLLHVVYEFQAFLNLFAKQSLGLSSGMAAQVSRGQHARWTMKACMHCHLQRGLHPGTQKYLHSSWQCSKLLPGRR